MGSLLLACASTPPPSSPSTLTVPRAPSEASPDEASPAAEKKPGSACGKTPSEPEIAEARELFRAGTEAYQLAEYSVAAERFRKSYELSCQSVLLYNLAMALERAGGRRRGHSRAGGVRGCRARLPQGRRSAASHRRDAHESLILGKRLPSGVARSAQGPMLASSRAVEAT